MNKLSFEDYAAARDEAELNEGPLLQALGGAAKDMWKGAINTARHAIGRGKRTYDVGKTKQDVEGQAKTFQDQMMSGIDQVVSENESVVTNLKGLTEKMNQNIAGAKAELDGAINTMVGKLQNMKVRGSGERLVTNSQILSIKKVTDQLKQLSDKQKNTMINLLRDMQAPVAEASGEMNQIMMAYDRLRGNVSGLLAEVGSALEKTAGEGGIESKGYDRQGVNVAPPTTRNIPTQSILRGTKSGALGGKIA